MNSGELLRRLLFLFRKRQFDRDLEEEMRFHLEMKAAALAPDAARRRFGNVALLQEDSREAWGWHWLDALIADARFAFRMMRRNPAFTAVAVLTLGLAIGGNTLVFSLVDVVLLRPLPYPEPERLFFLWTVEAQSQRAMNSSYPDFRDWQAQTRSFSGMSAYAQDEFNLTGVGEPERIDALRFTPGLLDVLQVNPTLGRPFQTGDEPNVALLGHPLWLRRFGGDPSVLGRSIHLDGKPHTIIGVCPPGFHFPPRRFSGDPEVFVPLTPHPDRTAYFLRIIGRLRPGVTEAQARADVDAVGRHLADTYPVERRAQAIQLRPTLADIVADARATSLVLMGAVGFVLLIACANLANLLLSQGAARRREIAIRVSIGASRGRIIRQLLVESCIIGLAGGAAGLLVARAGLPLLAAVAPERTGFFTRIRDAGIHLDLRILTFTAAVSLLAAILFGLLPAFQVTRPSAALARRGVSRRLRGGLIAVEVALALVLLSGAGLMINSMSRLLAVDLGFRPERLLTVELNLPRVRYATPEQQTAFIRRVLVRLEALPGVISAGAASDLPLTRAFSTGRIRVAGNPPTLARAVYHSVSPGYFEAMGIPLERGRLVSPDDTRDAPRVVVINRQMAERYWPNDDPLGKVVSVIGVRSEDPLTVVGVVGDVRLISRDLPPRDEIYMPFTQRAQSGMSIVLRTAVNPESLSAAIRREISRIDRDQPITQLKPMQALLATDVATRRFVLLLIGVFAAAALLLAGIGIFGVVSYAVKRRTSEIGIRMALGARSVHIALLVSREMALAVTVGIACGVGGAAGLTRLLAAYLYDVKPVDVPTFALAALGLAALAAAAHAIPARRAATIDPVQALRTE